MALLPAGGAQVITAGELFLYALTKRRSMTWTQFRLSLDALYSRSELAEIELDLPTLRSATLRGLAALGHVDRLRRDGDVSIVSCPAAIARLPRAGLPTAVLSGSRSPRTLQDIRAACRAVPSVHIRTDQPRASSWSPPQAVFLIAESVRDLEAIAGALKISFPESYPAVHIAAAMGSLSAYLDSCKWRPGEPPHGWLSAHFDPDQVRWRSDSAAGEDGLRLARYSHPVTGQYQFWLWRSRSEYARVDPDWGRYAVLASHGRRVLVREEATGDSRYPAGAPLPLLAARAFTLCTGLVPFEELVDNGLEVRRYHCHRNVPAEIFSAVAAKLSQEDE
jgi:hypothetical protein